MLPTDELRAALRPLVGKSHLLKLSDVMETLGLQRHECVVALDLLAGIGELRRTCDDYGEPYYWFVGADQQPGGCDEANADHRAPLRAE